MPTQSLRKSLRWISPAVVGVMLSGPAFAGAAIMQSPAPVTAPVTAPALPASAPASAPATTAGPSSAPSTDMARYQEREAATAGLETWKGGAGVSIYLGGTALAVVVLLLVLLIIF